MVEPKAASQPSRTSRRKSGGVAPPKPGTTTGKAGEAALALPPGSHAAAAVEQARDAGLLEGEHTEHVSFRAPKALVEAAKRQAGAASKTELGVAALALLAQPDPVAEYLEQNWGRLGPDHELEY